MEMARMFANRLRGGDRGAVNVVVSSSKRGRRAMMALPEPCEPRFGAPRRIAMMLASGDPGAWLVDPLFCAAVRRDHGCARDRTRGGRSLGITLYELAIAFALSVVIGGVASRGA